MTYHVELLSFDNRQYIVSTERITYSEAYRDYEALLRFIPDNYLVIVEKSPLPKNKPEEEELPF